MMMYLLSTGTEHVLSNFHFMINFQAYVLDLLRFFVDMVQCGKAPNPSPSREQPQGLPAHRFRSGHGVDHPGAAKKKRPLDVFALRSSMGCF